MTFMKYLKNTKKVGVATMAGVMAIAPVASSATTVFAATSTAEDNNTATANDLKNSDIIDESKKGSLSIRKYDITAAENAGDYKQGQYKATGEKDTRVENALEDYAIEGVQFSYLKVGNIEQYSYTQGGKTEVKIVYEIPTALQELLGLSKEDATDMTADGVSKKCDAEGVLHYTSDQIQTALSNLLAEEGTAAKDKLESYMYDYGTLDDTQDQSTKTGVQNMPKTDEDGYTTVSDLELGLYLIVETEVPENVTSAVDPWFVSIPFTNTSAQEVLDDSVSYDTNGDHNSDGVTNSNDAEGTDANVSGGEQWLYDMTCYPKNKTGNPTVDKSVRNAYSNTKEADKNGTVNSGSDYANATDSSSLVVYNDDTNAQNKEDADDASYIANRGGYTADGVTAGKDGAGYSTDYQYRDTTTASEGDLLDYILVSKLPNITSKATYLSEYTFSDQLSKGLAYGKDAKIAIYENKEDADANNTKNAEVIWDAESGMFTQEYTDYNEGSKMVVKLTEEGLKAVNGSEKTTTGNSGYANYYMVVYYTATVNSDASVVLGDEGNPNDVTLLWSRTSDGFYNTLTDRNYVYAYGIDLTKYFSDNKGKFSDVQFKIYNSTDAYYVVAEKTADGEYHVTGKTTDESKATSFVPNATTGKLYVNGIEADEYQLTEVATSDGYNLLKDQIVVDIDATDRDIIAAVAGVTGLDVDAATAIVKNYNDGIYDENGNLVTNQSDELTGEQGNAPAEEEANGNDIGKTDMFVGKIQPASASVDGVEASMTEFTGSDQAKSAHALVAMDVTNTKGFNLPKTGGNGLYIVTIVGAITAAGGCYLVTRKKRIA